MDFHFRISFSNRTIIIIHITGDSVTPKAEINKSFSCVIGGWLCYNIATGKRKAKRNGVLGMDTKLTSSVAEMAFARVGKSKMQEKADETEKQAEKQKLEMLAQTYGISVKILRAAVADMAEALEFG